MGQRLACRLRSAPSLSTAVAVPLVGREALHSIVERVLLGQLDLESLRLARPTCAPSIWAGEIHLLIDHVDRLQQELKEAETCLYMSKSPFGPTRHILRSAEYEKAVTGLRGEVDRGRSILAMAAAEEPTAP